MFVNEIARNNFIIRSRGFITIALLSSFILVTWAVLAPRWFAWIQLREGLRLHDPLLEILPAKDLSIYIFTIIYSLTLAAIWSLLKQPIPFLVTLQGYAILSILRICTISIFPLEHPESIIVLSDPFVDQLFYKQEITKDLFFSGHTSLLFLFAFTSSSKRLKWLFVSGGMCVAGMLLIQHAHYTVDVIAAPVFSYISFRVSKALILRSVPWSDH